MGPDAVCQRVGEVAAAIDEAAGTLDVKRADDGMDVGGGLVGTSAIEGIHVGEDGAQLGVLHMTGDEGISGHHEGIGMGKETRSTVRRAQVEEVNLVCQRQHSLDIGFQMLPLLGEVGCQGVDEALLTLGEGVELLVLGEVEAVGAVIIDVL